MDDYDGITIQRSEPYLVAFSGELIYYRAQRYIPELSGMLTALIPVTVELDADQPVCIEYIKKVFGKLLDEATKGNFI